jgi:hypothetical protein
MTSPRKPAVSQSPGSLSRRQFVAVVAAGSAAMLVHPAAADVTPNPPASPASGTALTPATQKEFDRQRTGMLSTLKTLRETPLPPGGDLSVVFTPRRSRKAGR